MHRASRTRTSLVVVALLAAISRAPLHAQAVSTTAGAGITTPTTAFAPCAQVQTILNPGPQAASCAVNVTGVAAAATATTNAVAGGFLETAISLLNSNTATDVSAFAQYYDYAMLSGPINQIFRVVLQSTAQVNSSTNLFIGGASVELFIASVLPGGGTLRSGSGGLLRNFPSTPFGASTLTASLNGSLLAGVNQFFFGLDVSSQNGGNSGSIFSTARASVPTISFFDVEGNDITSNIGVTFASTPVTASPEPASIALVATGLAGLGGFVRRRKKRGN